MEHSNSAFDSVLSESVLSTSASNTTLDPYPNKPRLTFSSSGTFKLTIFSDLHFGENPSTEWGPTQDVNSLKLMRTVLVDEAPDYIVTNGDLITGENTYRENSTELVDMIMRPLNEVGVPFSSSFGNHDNQKNISHREEILREQSISPLSYTRLAPEHIGGQGGEGNYWVPIYENAKDLRPALIIWFFDSRGGWSLGDTSAPLPDWVDASVAGWIQRETYIMDAAWGAAESTGRAALVFVHIPPHAIEKVSKSLNETANPGLNADALGQGSTQASDNPKSIGRDQPFWDALNTHVKNLRAIISGHNHGNEWCAREPTKDVIFCFNKHSGYGGYDRTGWGHGVRNMVFSPTALNKFPETWIRLEGGHTRARVTLDDAYGR
ncbi:Metallo-dependent phosphatase [Athelia psychrophila]|uniref:Metallo-dependent phosphatase n=1 Tax=Athelia psychrophila TaxID=1759441 RepID=A0A166ABD8_9AGAM|nr:Metallo-dependent phosphatase [Fibularhizoctonia sp. CBS 109695]